MWIKSHTKINYNLFTIQLKYVVYQYHNYFTHLHYISTFQKNIILHIEGCKHWCLIITRIRTLLTILHNVIPPATEQFNRHSWEMCANGHFTIWSPQLDLDLPRIDGCKHIKQKRHNYKWFSTSIFCNYSDHKWFEKGK